MGQQAARIFCFCVGDFMQIESRNTLCLGFSWSPRIVAHGKLTGRNSNHSLPGSWRLGKGGGFMFPKEVWGDWEQTCNAKIHGLCKLISFGTVTLGNVDIAPPLSLRFRRVCRHWLSSREILDWTARDELTLETVLWHGSNLPACSERDQGCVDIPGHQDGYEQAARISVSPSRSP